MNDLPLPRSLRLSAVLLAGVVASGAAEPLRCAGQWGSPADLSASRLGWEHDATAPMEPPATEPPAGRYFPRAFTPTPPAPPAEPVRLDAPRPWATPEELERVGIDWPMTPPAVPGLSEPAPERPPVVPAAAVLPPRDVAGPSPRAVELVVPQVEEQIRYAHSLASKGAVYSAEAGFIRALEWVAWSLDGDNPEQPRGRAVAAAFQALREAEDFVRAGETPGTLSVRPELVATHRTPVLKEADCRRTSPVAAMQAYCDYARSQLTAACGSTPAASEALYGLGRLQLLGTIGPAVERPLAAPKAIVFFDAALQSDPQNAPAANELGVLLARYGELQRAERVLVQCVRYAQEPQPWHNLAVVYERLGKIAEAERARHVHDTVLARLQAGEEPTPAGSAVVHWVDPEDFARTSGPVEGDLSPASYTTQGETVEPGHRSLMAPAAALPRSALSGALGRRGGLLSR